MESPLAETEEPDPLECEVDREESDPATVESLYMWLGHHFAVYNFVQIKLSGLGDPSAVYLCLILDLFVTKIAGLWFIFAASSSSDIVYIYSSVKLTYSMYSTLYVQMLNYVMSLCCLIIHCRKPESVVASYYE
jgi:hypothetical protein